MQTYNFLRGTIVNVIYLVVIVLTYGLADLLYPVLMPSASQSSTIVFVVVLSLMLFLPLAWVSNKFILAVDWRKSFARIVMEQTALLTAFVVFLILAIISSITRHVDIGMPVILLIISASAGASIKLIVYLLKRKIKLG